MDVNLYVGETDGRGYTLVLAQNPSHVYKDRASKYIFEDKELVTGLTCQQAIETFNSKCNTNYDFHFFENEWERWYSKLNKRPDGTRVHIESEDRTTVKDWMREHADEVARIKAKYGIV